MRKEVRISGREKKLNIDDFIVSKTDTKGKITYGNQIFMNIAGYSESELLGAPHNILRHPDMPRVVFKLLWDKIQAKEEVFAYVKNLSKCGAFYWVFTNVTASLDHNNKIIGYYSVRRKPNESAIKIIDGLYGKLLQIEKQHTMTEAAQYLETFLNDKGVSYDELINTLQRT